MYYSIKQGDKTDTMYDSGWIYEINFRMSKEKTAGAGPTVGIGFN